MNDASDRRDAPPPEPISTAPAEESGTNQLGSPDAAPGLPPSTHPLIVSQRWTAILLDLFLACGFFLLVRIGLALLGAGALGGDVEGPPASGWVLVGQRAVLCVVTVAILLILLRENGQPAMSIGVRTDGLLRACFWGIVAYASFLGAMLLVAMLVSRAWPGSDEAWTRAQEYNMRRLGEMTPAVVAAFSLITAVCEELLFRGFVLTRLRSLTRSWTPAILITSAAFAALHLRQGWLPVGLIFGPSILLGFWMVWRRNVLVPIIAHLLYDITSLVVMKSSA